MASEKANSELSGFSQSKGNNTLLKMFKERSTVEPRVHDKLINDQK